MILNGAKYPVIIARMKQIHPEAPDLIASNLSNHKSRHLLNNPITVESADGTKQTFLTGAYPAEGIVIPSEAVPSIPSLEEALTILIGVGLHNALNNPALVTPAVTLEAIKELRKLGGGADPMKAFLGAWQGVADKRDELSQKAKSKRTRRVTLEETTETEATPVPPEPVTVEGEWSAAELDTLALPSPNEPSSA